MRDPDSRATPYADPRYWADATRLALDVVNGRDVLPPAPETFTGFATPDQAWKTEAACTRTDPELFFSDDLADRRVALDICRTCPVRTACLKEALEHDNAGVWGGTSRKQRRAMRAGRGPQ